MLDWFLCKEYVFGEIIVVDAPIAVGEIVQMAEIGFGDMVKAIQEQTPLSLEEHEL